MQNFTLPEDAQIVNVSGLVKTEPAQNAVLQSGDNIPLGTVLTLTKGSEISLTFDDGSQQRVALGESSNSLSIETISIEEQAVAQSQLVDTGISDNRLNDIEAIQALIESGDGDIESPDTAAGDGTGNEGTSFVTLDRDGNELLAGAGYDTSEPDNVPSLADEPELVARGTQSSITGTSSGVVAEDGVLTASGTLVSNDIDTSDTPTFTAQSAVSSTYGMFAVGTDGVWTYELNNDTAQVLAGGEELTETFTVTETTADGESVEQVVTVTITGAEDAPIITGTSSDLVAEDGVLTASGTLVSTDIDLLDTPTFTAQSAVPGTYGTFAVGTDGVWTYDLDNATAQSLAGGEELTETFTVVATTTDGESVEQVVTVTITGAEDAPVITGTSSNLVAEDGNLSATGTLVSTDIDASDTPTFSAQNGVPGTYGTFAVDTDGAWIYDLNNDTAQVLAGGEELTEAFTVTATTADGESVEQVVTITITGAEDAPVITGTSSNSVAEDGNLSATGTLVTTDVDASDTPTFSAQSNVTGTYGTFAVGTNGVWTYDLNNDTAQSLGGDQSFAETFTVVSTTADGESVEQVVTVTITGTEDAPVIIGTSSDSVAEDDVLTASGTLATSDADAADTPTFTAQTGTVGSYGSFDVTTGGDWSYALDNVAAQSLAGGDVVTETFTVAATTADGESVTQTVTVTVTGAEDAPVITGTSTGVAAEDGTLAATGTLVTSDADAADTPTFTAQTGTVGSYGSFDVTTGGDWSYALDNVAAQSLAGGEIVTETFTVAATTADGESVEQVVLLTINGMNDAPIITSSVQASTVVEDSVVAAEVTVGGRVTSSDVDTGSTAVYTTTDTAAHGTFTLTQATGAWTYTLVSAGDATVQALNVGQSLIETFTVTVTDENNATATQDVTVNITGTNDAATVSSQTKAVSEGDVAAELNTNGKLTITDVDSDQTVTWAAGELVGTYGTFTVAADGTWSYAGNNAHDGLNVNDTVSDQITVTSADGTTTGVIKVNITGTNDAPEAQDDSFSLSEGGAVSGNVITHNDGDGMLDNDVDSDVLSVTHINDEILVFDPSTGDATFTIIDGVYTAVTPADVLLFDDSTFNGSQDNGILRINSDGDFTYENKGFLYGSDKPSFEYTLSDTDGDTSKATVTIGVATSAPDAYDDATGFVFSADNPRTISGNVTGLGRGSSGDARDDFGLDSYGTPAVTQVVYMGIVHLLDSSNTSANPVSIVTDFGTLSIDNKGNYTFSQGADQPIEPLVFNYTIQDGDTVNPETATADSTINITPPPASGKIAPEPSAKFIELDLDETSGSIDTFSHTLGKTDFDEGIQGFIQDMQFDLSDVLAQTHTDSLEEYLDSGADNQKVALDLETGKSTPMEQDLVLDKAGSESEESVYVTNSLLADGGMIISDAFAANPAPLPDFDTQDVL